MNNSKVDLTTILETNEVFRKEVLSKTILQLKKDYSITLWEAQNLRMHAMLLIVK